MKRVPFTAFLIAMAPVVVFAHTGTDHGAHHFANGLLHPFTGLDHILAMAAIGMWSVQLGGRARWSVPLGFLALMVVGGSLALSHASMPFVESGILASVLIMGLLVMFALRLPMPAAVALAGLFAIFHGYAHIAEMPPTASTFAYGSGFILASAALLAAGAALARLLTIARQLQWLRLFGGATAMAALLLAIS